MRSTEARQVRPGPARPGPARGPGGADRLSFPASRTSPGAAPRRPGSSLPQRAPPGPISALPGMDRPAPWPGSCPTPPLLAGRREEPGPARARAAPWPSAGSPGLCAGYDLKIFLPTLSFLSNPYTFSIAHNFTLQLFILNTIMVEKFSLLGSSKDQVVLY